MDVAAQSEQRRLLFLGAKESSRDHETTGPRATMRTMLQVGHLPIAVDLGVAQPRQQALQSRGHARDDGVFGRPRFPGVEHGIASETGIGPHPQFTHVGRHIAEASLQQLNAAAPGAGIAGAQFGVPQIAGVGFHAQQRIIRTLAAIAWVVADRSAILVAEDKLAVD